MEKTSEIMSCDGWEQRICCDAESPLIFDSKFKELIKIPFSLPIIGAVHGGFLLEFYLEYVNKEKFSILYSSKEFWALYVLSLIHISSVIQIIRESGLKNRTNSMFTEIEGEWDDVMAVVKKATFYLAEQGLRTEVILKADIRPGHTEMMEHKTAIVEQLLQETK